MFIEKQPISAEKGDTMKYIGYYDHEPDSTQGRNCSLAAMDKMNHIMDAMVRCGVDVDPYSMSDVRGKSSKPAKAFELSKGIKLHFIHSIGKKTKLHIILGDLQMKLRILWFFLTRVQKGETIICYHSLYYCKHMHCAR